MNASNNTDPSNTTPNYVPGGLYRSPAYVLPTTTTPVAATASVDSKTVSAASSVFGDIKTNVHGFPTTTYHPALPQVQNQNQVQQKLNQHGFPTTTYHPALPPQ